MDVLTEIERILKNLDGKARGKTIRDEWEREKASWPKTHREFLETFGTIC